MYGNQDTELLLGNRKIYTFGAGKLRWLKLFPLIILYYNFFDSAYLFAVLKTLYVSAVVILVFPIFNNHKTFYSDVTAACYFYC